MKKEIWKRMGLALLVMCGLVQGGWAQDTIVGKERQYRKVVLEEFTGMHCPNCPSGHKAANAIAEAYPEECFLINIHAGSLAVPYPGETDLRTAYGESLASRAGVTAIPSAEVNRHRFAGIGGLTTSDREEWLPMAEEILGMESCVNVGAEAVLDWESRELEVRVQLYYTGEAGVSMNRIHVALLQEGIEGEQDGSDGNPEQELANGKYDHRHVLRDLLTGLEGDEVEAAAPGGLVERSYAKELPAALNGVPLELLDLRVVVFVTEGDEEILNAGEAEIRFENGPEYVFELGGFEQMEQASCDNRVRIGFTLKNRNPEDKPVERVEFEFRTPENRIGRYEAELPGFGAGSTREIESGSFELDRTGEESEVEVQVVGVNGSKLEKVQEGERVKMKKDYVQVSGAGVVLDLWQDRWGSEISWELRSEEGEKLAGESGYGDLPQDGTERHMHELKLSEGCNVFVIRDAMKDGINNGDGEGHLQLSDEDGQVLLSNDGTYGDSLVWLIRQGMEQTGNERQAETGLRIWPNPAGETAYAELVLPEAAYVDARLMDLQGKVLWSRRSFLSPSGTLRLEIPVGELPAGVYVLGIGTGDSFSFAKLMVR